MPHRERPVLSERFEQALVYACRAHNKHTRKGAGVPYISHLMAVSAIVLEHGGTENEAIAALLHDAAEDAGGVQRLEDINVQFGTEVAGIVAGCTDTYTVPKPDWEMRKIAHVERVKAMPESVRIVVAADKIHNAMSVIEDYREVGEEIWSRFTGGRDGTLWYYRAMCEALHEGADQIERPGLKRLLRVLTRRVQRLHELAGEEFAAGE
jgi:(p)ppGpp synthase/HD superfamily hydrolase